MRYGALLIVLPLLGVLATANAADAAAPPPSEASPITDHLALSAGFYWGHVNTFGQFNSGAGVPGTTLTAEQDLGLTDQVYQPRIEIMFRLEQRGRLRVNFFDLRRNGETQLDRKIQFGDQVFETGDTVQSSIDWRQMDLTYTYSFLRGDRYELGAGVGAHLLEAQASAQIPGTPQRTEYSQAGPFATLALDGTYLIDRHWSVNARAQYLRVSIGSFTGMLDDYHADLQYRWRRNLAFGVSYDHAQDEVDVRNHDPSGEIRLTFTGPQLFVRVSY
ncbi:MAG TPA: hypothetical protein VIX87_10860 [Steroidobacteraceae bacterium]